MNGEGTGTKDEENEMLGDRDETMGQCDNEMRCGVQT